MKPNDEILWKDLPVEIRRQVARQEAASQYDAEEPMRKEADQNLKAHNGNFLEAMRSRLPHHLKNTKPEFTD